MHPFVGDLSTLTDNELMEKITQLTTRQNQAYRMGYYDALQQINMLLADYMGEKRRRDDKMLEELMNKSKDFKKIIDVK